MSLGRADGSRRTTRAATSDLTAIIPPTSRPASQGTPRPHTPRDLFARRRSETIEAHLETARRAFETGNYAAAVAAAEQAAILDPEEPRILDVLESARQRLDERQVEAWLSEAEDRVRQADLDGASQLVAKALQLDPESAAARRLRTAIDRGRQQRVIDRDAVVTVERARAAVRGRRSCAGLVPARRLQSAAPAHRPDASRSHGRAARIRAARSRSGGPASGGGAGRSAGSRRTGAAAPRLRRRPARAG